MGEYPNGDPELHHVAGLLYAEGVYIMILGNLEDGYT
jgi:hypothetical protein